MTGGSARASLLRVAAHGGVFLGAFVAGYASGAALELSSAVRAGVLVSPFVAAVVLLGWAKPAGGGRAVVRGVILAAGAGFGLGFGLGSINGSDPMPFMYGA